MDRKKELQELIKLLKKLTGKGQEEISEGAGYKKKSLTQILSNGIGVDAAIKRLKLAYKNELKISTPHIKPARRRSTSETVDITLDIELVNLIIDNAKVLKRLEASLADNKEIILSNTSLTQTALYRLAEQDGRELNADPMGIFQASLQIAQQHYNSVRDKKQEPENANKRFFSGATS